MWDFERIVMDLADKLVKIRNPSTNPTTSSLQTLDNVWSNDQCTSSSMENQYSFLHPWDQDFQFYTNQIRVPPNQMNHRARVSHDKVPDETLESGDTNFDLNDFVDELKPKRPPSSYLCNICYKTGHYIQYCPKAPVKTLTPYQGNKRCFGEFICPKCKRNWKSSKSFAEIGQECKKCKITVFPKKQYALLKRNAKDISSSCDSMSTSVSSNSSSFVFI